VPAKGALSGYLNGKVFFDKLEKTSLIFSLVSFSTLYKKLVFTPRSKNIFLINVSVYLTGKRGDKNRISKIKHDQLWSSQDRN